MGALRFLGKSVVAIALALLAGEALGHHNGPWLPGDIGPAQREAIAKGYITYCFDANASVYPGFRQQAGEVASFAASKGLLPTVEVSWGPDCDVRNIMASEAQFPCGSAAAACVDPYSNPVTVWYRRSLNYSNWRPGLCHEGINTGHVMWLHEQYNDQQFTSEGKTWTCMDFGTGVWQVPDWDVERIFNALVPDAPCPRGFQPQGDWVFVSWGAQRCDGGAAHLHQIATNSNATHVLYGWSPDGSVIYPAPDICGPAYGYCIDNYGTHQRAFDAFWRGCLYIRAFNYGTVFIPQVSAPAFWTWLGCW